MGSNMSISVQNNYNSEEKNLGDGKLEKICGQLKIILFFSLIDYKDDIKSIVSTFIH